MTITDDFNPSELVTRDMARCAVVRLITVVRMRTGVSMSLAKFLLGIHAGGGTVDLGVYCRLDSDNKRALEQLIRYSLFQDNYELPISWDEADYLFAYAPPKRRKRAA